MINKELHEMLMENKDHYLIPGEIVAHVQADNALTHAFILLSTVKYSEIPVLDNDSRFVGLLSLSMVTEPMLELDDLSFGPLEKLKVKDVMRTDVATIEDPYDLEHVLHLLVNHPFLPVVTANGDFTGIVTRREAMKSFNHILHDIDKEFDLTAKKKTIVKKECDK